MHKMRIEPIWSVLETIAILNYEFGFTFDGEKRLELRMHFNISGFESSTKEI